MSTFNANTEHPCIDCGRLDVATIVQSARVAGRVNHWHICASCARKFEERKDAFASEWRETEQALRDALTRTPFGQAAPGMRTVAPAKAPPKSPSKERQRAFDAGGHP